MKYLRNTGLLSVMVLMAVLAVSIPSRQALAATCTPDTSCGALACIGTSCPDGCGGEVQGTKNCGGNGGPVSGACTAPNVCRTGGCDPSAFDPASGTCSASGTTCCKMKAQTTVRSDVFVNPLKYDSIEGVLTSLLGTLQGIIVILAIIFIVIGALLYITSAGSESRITLAKGAITAAMIGLAIALAVPSFLKEIAQILGWTNVNNTPIAGAQSLGTIAANVLKFLLSIVGLICIIMLVIGGTVYLTAAGDQGRADTAKKIVTYSIIGIAVALAALVIVTQIAAFFA